MTKPSDDKGAGTSGPYGEALQRLRELMPSTGWEESHSLPPAERDLLIAELLRDPDVRARAEACAFKDATMDTLAEVVEAALRKKNRLLDGCQFFDLVVEITQRVERP